MKLSFTKMEGCGNDYLYIDCMNQEPADPAALSVRLSDRHFGVGGDGIILVCPSGTADARMRIFNADGSEGRMCGNGVRCVGKFLYDRGIARREVITVDTLSGIKTLHMQLRGGEAVGATVDMGTARFRPEEIPVLLPGDSVIDRPVEIGGRCRRIACVSMGNPHCVVFGEDPRGLELAAEGPCFEKSPLFPEGVNTEFVQRLGPAELRMRVWERGSGETLACGTGACAAAVAAIRRGFCQKGEDILVHLTGGDLTIRYTGERVFMTGPAVTVFNGEVEIGPADGL